MIKNCFILTISWSLSSSKKLKFLKLFKQKEFCLTFLKIMGNLQTKNRIIKIGLYIILKN